MRRKPTKGRRTSGEIERKLMSAQNWNKDVQRTSEGVRRMNSKIEGKPISAQNKNEDVRRTSNEIDKKRSFALRLKERR